MYLPYFVSLYHPGVPALPLAPGGQPALGPAVLLLGTSDHPAVVDDDDDDVDDVDDDDVDDDDVDDDDDDGRKHNLSSVRDPQELILCGCLKIQYLSS